MATAFSLIVISLSQGELSCDRARAEQFSSQPIPTASVLVEAEQLKGSKTIKEEDRERDRQAQSQTDALIAVPWQLSSVENTGKQSCHQEVIYQSTVNDSSIFIKCINIYSLASFVRCQWCNLCMWLKHIQCLLKILLTSLISLLFTAVTVNLPSDTLTVRTHSLSVLPLHLMVCLLLVFTSFQCICL